MLDLAALLRVPQVDTEYGFDLSLDGKKLAFAWNSGAQWEIFQLELSNNGKIEQLTQGPGGKFSPKYSPDGQQVAYLVDLDGSEEFDIWLMDLESLRCENLTPRTAFSFQPNISWSPDSSQIACIADQKGTFCTYLLDLETKEFRLMLDTPQPDWDLCYAPDGAWLAVEAEGQAQDYQVHLIAIPSGQVMRLEKNGKSLNAQQVCWSPDSSRLAFISDIDGYNNICLLNLQGGEFTWLTRGDGDKSMPAWSADGNRLVYIHAQGPENWLVVLNLSSGESKRYQAGLGVHARPCFASSDQQLVFTFENPSHPPDLWLLSLPEGSCCQLTDSLPAEFDKSLFHKPDHLEYTSIDGVRVPALLYRPVVCERLPPAVILIHGGPSWLFQYSWYPLIQHMLSRGWLVLAPNYRGSTGYGRTWQLASRFDLGGADANDVIAAAQFLKQANLADPARITVTGRSHGGYLTMVCLTQAPEIWAGGSAVVPFLNWFTSHVHSREDLQHWDTENMGDPIVNAELWRSRSPYFFLDRITAPVQLICGAHDPRCPASESIEAHGRLLSMGKMVDFKLYADEGHVFLKMENQIDAELRRVEFLTRCLG
jgi:dipeptidyl aminopeptidase/acylaminoacyl peptidase